MKKIKILHIKNKNKNQKKGERKKKKILQNKKDTQIPKKNPQRRREQKDLNDNVTKVEEKSWIK